MSFGFCLSITTRFDNKHMISFWVGTCDPRGHGPPAQWLSLLLYTPEGAGGAGLDLRFQSSSAQSFDFCLRISTHLWTTRTDEVAWPQEDQCVGGDL